MKKELPQLVSKLDDRQGHLVTVFLGSLEYECTGAWNWDLHSEAVYCSDVIMAFPPDFEGTKGIIHPADKELVLQRIVQLPGDPLPFLQFRIITTWGEVKTLTGRDLQVTEVHPFFEATANKISQNETAPDMHRFEPGARAFGVSELLHKTGSWWLKLESNQMYYSDGVFAVYDLPAQSFNGHVHTFFPYIHSEDRDQVIEAFTAAFRRQAPLHLEFRIVTARGVSKIVRQITYWGFNNKGSLILYGALQDITEAQEVERQGRIIQYEQQLAQRLLSLNE